MFKEVTRISKKSVLPFHFVAEMKYFGFKNSKGTEVNKC